MSTNLVPAGESIDFNEDPNLTILNMLDNATNWSATDPARAGVRFSTDWYKPSSMAYQIIVKPVRKVRTTKTLGSGRYAYHDVHNVHIFAASRQSGRDKKWKMEQEVDRILSVTDTQPGTGLLHLKHDGPFEVPEEKLGEDFFHSVFNIDIYYQKVLVA